MSPERLELHKQAMKKLSQDPSWRQSIKNGIEKRSNNAQWRQSMKNFAKSKWKPILQYSLDGKFIARYDHAGLVLYRIDLENNEFEQIDDLIEKSGYRSGYNVTPVERAIYIGDSIYCLSYNRIVK